MKQFILLKHCIAIALVTIVLLLVYATVQQSYRTGLDDPQFQMVWDTRAKLEKGKPFSNLLPADSIDIANSLAPFTMLYDLQGKPLAATGFLGNTIPILPAGILDAARAKGEYHVTWQPRRSVRVALVIAASTTAPVGYIVAGRQMIEVEKRIATMALMVFVAWLFCAALVILALLLQYRQLNKLK